MKLNILTTPKALGQAAASRAANVLNMAIRERGVARLLLSTGQSQFETLAALRAAPVDWSNVELFHLDEYIDLPISHPASFRNYLNDRFIRHITLKAVHLVNGEGDIEEHIQTLNEAVTAAPIDLGLVGIGENGHIAFNDPPADFETEEPYIIVSLNDTCKKQQVREGWFPDMASVPDRAITMSVRQILKCRTILSCVPHVVKAEAVKKTLEEDITNQVPATILKKHRNATLYLDHESASMLDDKTIAKFQSA